MTDFKEIAQATILDTWVCQTFKVLPTDPRFMELTENQKTLLMVAHMENISSEDLYNYAKHMRYEKMQQVHIDDEEKDSLRALGYTDEQIDNMNDEILKAGV